MLQTVQERYAGRKLSSLYCVWTTRDGSPNSPLIALWIDRSMSSFEGEFAFATESGCEELSAEEPGSSNFPIHGLERVNATEMESFPH